MVVIIHLRGTVFTVQISGSTIQSADRIQNVIDGRGQNVRLVGPPATQAPFRTSAPIVLPSAPATPNGAKRRSGTGSNLAGLPDLPNVRWEPNQRGGYEAWFVPTGSTRRDQFTYLGYLGKRAIERWRQQNVLNVETERWVAQKRAEKGV
jgi:hypothetical protein